MEAFNNLGMGNNFGDDDDVCSNFDLELLNDGDGDNSSTAKECTGRWTREEHQLFIKGLELYGKGWKKIASLIKTRTVVQIRTHAQKYFLKLSKARQNGDLAEGRGYGGLRRKKKRLENKPLSVAPLLQPFLVETSSKLQVSSSNASLPSAEYQSIEISNDTANNNSGNGNNGGVDTHSLISQTLYHFLSPSLVADDDGGQPPRVLSTNDLSTLIKMERKRAGSQIGEGEGGRVSHSLSLPNLGSMGIGGEGSDISSDETLKVESSKTSSSRSNPADSANTTNNANSYDQALSKSDSNVDVKKLLMSIRPPEWYQKGKDVMSLLKEAEQLNWEGDEVKKALPLVLPTTSCASLNSSHHGGAIKTEKNDTSVFIANIAIKMEGSNGHSNKSTSYNGIPYPSTSFNHRLPSPFDDNLSLYTAATNKGKRDLLVSVGNFEGAPSAQKRKVDGINGNESNASSYSASNITVASSSSTTSSVVPSIVTKTLLPPSLSHNTSISNSNHTVKSNVRHLVTVDEASAEEGIELADVLCLLED